MSQESQTIKRTEQEQRASYLEAEKERLNAQRRPSREHLYQLVYFVERDGEPYPVYREVD